MKNKKNSVSISKDIKKFLIIWMIVISNIYFYLFISLNPSNTTLQQRSDFFSYERAIKYINEENSELTYGSEIMGSVMISIQIPRKQINKEFTLRIEADTKRIWNFTSDGETHYPSKDVRIEIIINGKIDKVYIYSEISKNYYSSKMTYGDLIVSNRGRKILCSERFNATFSRNSIKIRLVTNHSLREDKNIFSDYFHNEEYSLTICIGDPDLIFFISSIFLFLNYWIFIIVIFLRRLFLN